MTVHSALALISIDSVDEDDGQGLAEYALILALIAIVAIVALLFLGTQVSDKLSIVGSTLESVTPLSTHRGSQSRRPVGQAPAGRSYVRTHGLRARPNGHNRTIDRRGTDLMLDSSRQSCRLAQKRNRSRDFEERR